MKITRALLLREESLGWYQKAMYQAEAYLKSSRTYPGNIKPACPGNALCYYSKLPRREILPETDRHYWRAVVDDPPQIRREIDVRIRFSTMIWVLSGWEKRLHYQIVTVPLHATLEQLYCKMVTTSNLHYLDFGQLIFLLDGMEVPMSSTLENLGATLGNNGPKFIIDAVEKSFYVEHLPDRRRKDWNEDEFTLEDEGHLTYKEMSKVPHDHARPYYRRSYLRY